MSPRESFIRSLGSSAEPSVTVLMPAYNAARWLKAAVHSVLAEADFTFELLVIDDGSRDESAAILEAIADPRLRVIRHTTNQGLIAALNRGLTEARAPYIARLDADDLWKPGRLMRQRAALCDPDTVMVTGFSELIAQDGRHIAISRFRFSPESYYYLLHFRNCLAHSTVMFRRDVALALGGYREAFKYAEDFDLWARLAQNGKIRGLAEVVTAYRVHEASVSQREAERQRAVAATIAAQQLAQRLGEPIESVLAELYSERAFMAASKGELTRAAAQFVRAQDAIWHARPAYCRDAVLRSFMQVEWSRRALSFARRGVRLSRPSFGTAVFPSLMGGVRGVIDELNARRLYALLPRTHP